MGVHFGEYWKWNSKYHETQNFSSSDILKIEYLLPVLLISVIVIVPVIYKFIKKDFCFDYKKITYNQFIRAGGSAG